jgi:hypothetical protein
MSLSNTLMTWPNIQVLMNIFLLIQVLETDYPFPPDKSILTEDYSEIVICESNNYTIHILKKKNDTTFLNWNVHNCFQFQVLVWARKCSSILGYWVMSWACLTMTWSSFEPNTCCLTFCCYHSKSMNLNSKLRNFLSYSTYNRVVSLMNLKFFTYSPKQKNEVLNYIFL